MERMSLVFALTLVLGAPAAWADGNGLARIDTSGDGSLSRAEVRAAIAARFPKADAEARADQVMKRFDTRSDGLLRGEEIDALQGKFSSWRKKHPKKSR